MTLLFAVRPVHASQGKIYQSVDSIPDPKKHGQGYVSDPQQLLDPVDADSLNSILTTLDKKLGVEVAVVIVNDFDQDSDDFTFAAKLFRAWGIGKRQADNGLLLFIATERRQYRFITGYGLEGLLPDATLGKIGDRVLVPAFRDKEYGRGILRTMNVISGYLQQPNNRKELETLLQKQSAVEAKSPSDFIWSVVIIMLAAGAGWQIHRFRSKIPAAKNLSKNLYGDISFWMGLVLVILTGFFALFVFFTGHVMEVLAGIPAAFFTICCVITIFYLFFAHLNVLSRMRQHYIDDVSFADQVKQLYYQAWWQIILSPLLLVLLPIEYFRDRKLTKRLAPMTDANGQPMQRLNRDQNKDAAAYLSEGQLKEEELGSVIYDVWAGKDTSIIKLSSHPGYCFDDFEACPQCGFRTYTHPIEITEQRATYTRSGRAKRVRLCRHCKHEYFIEQVTLPMLAKTTTSSSSSSGSGNSGNSSSSSGSSWGGGSTGGGGAGGRW